MYETAENILIRMFIYIVWHFMLEFRYLTFLFI